MPRAGVLDPRLARWHYPEWRAPGDRESLLHFSHTVRLSFLPLGPDLLFRLTGNMASPISAGNPLPNWKQFSFCPKTCLFRVQPSNSSSHSPNAVFTPAGLLVPFLWMPCILRRAFVSYIRSSRCGMWSNWSRIHGSLSPPFPAPHTHSHTHNIQHTHTHTHTCSRPYVSICKAWGGLAFLAALSHHSFTLTSSRQLQSSWSQTSWQCKAEVKVFSQWQWVPRISPCRHPPVALCQALYLNCRCFLVQFSQQLD